MKKFFEITLGFIFLALLIFGLYYLLCVWVPSNTTIAMPLITAIIGFSGIIYTQYQSKSRDIRESHRASKIETYRDFFDLINLFQTSNKKGIEIDHNSNDLQKKLQKLTENFILWASDEVIQAWIEFRVSTADSTDNKNNPYLALEKIDKVYRAIRKDLGHLDKNIKELDLIRMNLSDPNEI